MKSIIVGMVLISAYACHQNEKKTANKQSQINPVVTAKDILGNPEYQAISYGGYREISRDVQPSMEELKEDMKILSAMGIKVLRTYNVQRLHASNLLQAIYELKRENPAFEMYVMLGAWIDCKNAWTDVPPDHDTESEQNASEIARAVTLVNKYPEIVKILAVGNEAMVKWATSYYVQPGVILKWVNHLQGLKKKGELPKDLWITSSDNFASWGGGSPEYHVPDLEKLWNAVDFVSMHTYPMHDTHYNPAFWGVKEEEEKLSKKQKIEAVMLRAKAYAVSQYNSVFDYMESLGIKKPIHIGETGWASASNGHYGDQGSKATDEYKEAIYYHQIKDWANKEGLSCFYFEAFNEKWKDVKNQDGSENHFGLFTIDGKAKYALWSLVDNGTFDGLTRGGNPILKTYDGNETALLDDSPIPETRNEVIID